MFWIKIFQSERLCGLNFMRRDHVSGLLCEDIQKHVRKSLFRLRAEGGALVPCPGGKPSFNSPEVVYAVLQRTQPSGNVVAVAELLDGPVG